MRSSYGFDPPDRPVSPASCCSTSYLPVSLTSLPSLQPLLLAPYQPVSTISSPKAWTLAFLSLIFPFFLHGMIFSYIFNLHLITDASLTFSGPTLLVILVYLSHSILQIKYLKVNSLLSQSNYSLFRLPIIRTKIFQLCMFLPYSFQILTLDQAHFNSNGNHWGERNSNPFFCLSILLNYLSDTELYYIQNN